MVASRLVLVASRLCLRLSLLQVSREAGQHATQSVVCKLTRAYSPDLRFSAMVSSCDSLGAMMAKMVLLRAACCALHRPDIDNVRSV